MEMASAHGLALKLVEMNRLDRINRNELCEIISEEDKIIKSWYIACQSRFSKKEFFILMRKTMLFVFSGSSLKEQKKKELLKGTSVFFDQFSNPLKNSSDIRKPFIDVILDPWKNKHFSWEELFQKRINVRDQKVQQYFHAEPEEIVMARAHFFSNQNKDDMSMTLAKNSFLFHSRILKSFKIPKPVVPCNMSRKGIPSMDWYLHNLRKKKSLNAIYSELKQLTCHEGVLLIMRLRGLRLLPFALSVVQIFLLQELVHPSKFCCTKKLFTLWSLLHKEKETPMEEVNEEIRKMVAVFAPSSAHLYLLVDALWEQFGMSYVNIYVELYIRGLTSDLNLLEAAKHQDKHEDVKYLESHISSIFYKLSTLFIDYHQRVARECMFSAFSLKPTKNRLYILQSMTHGILSDENEMIGDSSFNHSIASVQECKCETRCTGFCKSMKEHVLDHPILSKGIPNIPYSVVKDLVGVLESVRCFRFQYNVFDWYKNATDLGDYLRDFTLCKSYESDTECEEDSAPVSEQMHWPAKISTNSLQPSSKRKSDSCDLKEMFPLEIGANIEVANEELQSKRMRTEDHIEKMAVVSKDILDIQARISQKFGLNLGMEDAIENVIRATLDNNKQKLSLSSNKPHAGFSNGSFSQVNDMSENVSSLYKPVNDNHVYPYSLTNYGKEKSLNKECKTPFSADVGKPPKYNYFPPASSVLSQALTSPPISRESVISPTLHLPKNSNAYQEQSSREMNQNKYLLKTMNNTYYSKSKDIKTDISNTEKKLSVYQQEASNLTSKNSLYGQMRNAPSTVSLSSQYIGNQSTMQIAHRSSISSNFPKEHFSTSTPVHSSSSVSTPLNLTQAKLSTVQSPQYVPVAHHHVSKASSSVLRTDPRYSTTTNTIANSNICKTTVKKVNENLCFQNNELVYCDRSSVIQHTTQHTVSEVEIPDQLSVSVNSDAAEQIRNNSEQNIKKILPFKVNVSNQAISNSPLAVPVSFVIARKQQPQFEAPSQPISSSISPVASDTITIPGILASPSVIVSPSWEAQRKAHGDMMYKKNLQAIAASASDKRIYKNRLPYVKPIPIKSTPKVIAYDKNNNSQVHKALIRPIVHAIPSAHQSNTNASQNWTIVNKSASSQEVSKTTSSQPWYTEPYPKPHNSRNVSSVSSGNSSTTIEKSAEASIKIFQPGQNESKSFAMYSKETHRTMAKPTVTTPLPHSPHNPVSESSVKLHDHHVTTFAMPNSSISTNSPALVKVPSTPNNKMANIKTYSNAHKVVKTSPVIPTVQLSGSEYKNSNSFVASNIIDNSLQFSQTSSRTVQNTCCSPTELNPCQNCSLPSENSLIQASSEKTLNDHPNPLIPREKMMLEKGLASAACNSNFPFIKEDNYEQSHVTQLNCPHCSNLFSEIEIHHHILNCSSRNLGTKSSNLVSEIDSTVMVTENFCAKTATNIVPEQNALFQKEKFLNLPQTTKSFINTDDDKNLEEIDTNAFSTCMDLINNDQDLERIVQGIDSLDQIDNNYLPYMQPANATGNFLSNNLCNAIQNNDIRDVKTLQNSEAYSKINEINYESPQLQGKKMSVFEFTESKSVHQSVFIKPEVLSPEKMSTNTSKVSPELTSFSEIAEMIKGAMTENCPNEFESIEACLKTEPDLNAGVDQGQPIDSTLPGDQNNFIHAIENVVQQNILKIRQNTMKFKFSCLYCSKEYSSRVNVRRHIIKIHPDLPIEFHKVCKSPEISSSDMHDNNLKSKDLSFNSGNSYHNSIDSFNPVTDSDIKQKISSPVVMENGSPLPKGRVKGIIKNPQTQCKFCGKTLTQMYMKKHILTQHKEMIVKTENSSDLNADLNQSLPADSASPADSINVPSLSPLLEQDFDSSTCLSASDALKKNSSFTVTETSHNSEDSGKLTKKTNVKFNFDVLEFSKDAESDSKLTSRRNPSLVHENPLLEHLLQENPPVEDLKQGIPLFDNLQLENPPLEDLQLENPPLEDLQLESPPLEDLQLENPPLEALQFEDPSLKNLKLEDFSHESVEGFQENNVSHAKTAKNLQRKKPCPICNKTYLNLKRHLTNIHKIPTTSNSVINIQSNKVDNLKGRKHQLGLCNNFQKDGDAKNESMCVASEKTSVPVSEELAKIERVPNTAANLIPRTKCHDYTPHPNAGKTLLKAVLQSNFSKTYKLSQKNSETDSLVQDKQISIDETAKSFEKDLRLPCENSSAIHEPLPENLNCSYPELKSAYETSAFEPVENQEILAAVKTSECSYSFSSDSDINNELSLPVNLPNITSNDGPKLDINSDAKYSHGADSQNLSHQSCEISPISQIISNVSRCHFGGTSNNVNEKEVFEDNSLKLLIPENRDVCSSETVDDLEDVKESNKLYFNQSNVYNQNNTNNDQDHIDPKLDLLSCKNDSKLCNQVMKQEIFQEKLSDSSFLDVSDVPTKKSEKITSVNCEEVLVQKNSDDLENISLENQSYTLQNSSQVIESYELENILQVSKSYALENSFLENKSFEPASILANESCEFKETVPRGKNYEHEKESCANENSSVKNESCELDNTVPENESYETVNILENQSSEHLNPMPENEYCKPANTLENECCALANTMPETEDCERVNFLENESCELESTMPEAEDCNSTNVLESESCDLESVLQESSSCNPESIMHEENDSFNFGDNIHESESCEQENISSENEHNESKGTDKKNKASAIQNILTKNESEEFTNSLQEEKHLKSENAPHKNKLEDSLQKSESYKMKHASFKKELCQLENTISTQDNVIMCRVCQQNLDSMEILSKHLKEFHDIPVLKKHVSEHSLPKKSTHSLEIKLSPPKLKLGSNESDSESMSDFDSPQHWSRTTNDTSPVTPKKGISSDNLLASTYPLVTPKPHNLPSSLKEIKHSKKGSKAKNSSSMQSPSSSVSNLNHQNIMTLNKLKRHSFEDICSVASVKGTDTNSEQLPFHLKDNFYKNGQRKSNSLPNIKIIFPSKGSNHVEHSVKNTTNPVIVKNIYVESSLSEDASFSSVNDSSENKSLYDSSSLSSSSQNTTAPLNEITINSNLILPNRVSIPSMSHKKIILKSKLAGRKLIIQRLKTYKKKSKSKLFHRPKNRSQKRFKPIIMTLKEATDVDKFLKTHKQPIVKLIRLKENEFDSSSNEKTCPIPRVECDKINMEPVVKLEKIHIPKKISEIAAVGDRLLIPNLLQKNIKESCKSNKDTARSCKYPKLRRKAVRSKVHNLSDESIEISDDSADSCNSTDSVQFIKAVPIEEKVVTKPDKIRDKICPTQATKKCFVVLNRLSV